jgi:hypothetical protein
VAKVLKNNPDPIQRSGLNREAEFGRTQAAVGVSGSSLIAVHDADLDIGGHQRRSCLQDSRRMPLAFVEDV